MRHRFFLAFRDRSGATTFEEELTDFRALYHDLAFRAVCARALANDGRWGEMTLEPLWHEGNLRGITAQLDGLSRSYGLVVFADQANELFATRRSGGTDEERPKWAGRIAIRHVEVEELPTRRRAIVRRQPYPIIDREQCPVAMPDRRSGRSSILIASGLLADLKAESADSLDEERADFLTGYVVGDAAGSVSVLLLDRIAADLETTRSLVHFGFSAQTFAAAQRELESRGTDRVILGWHHNHPPPCGRNCLMAVPACGTDNVFFSLADRTVHRRGFNIPYMVALVTGKGANRRADDPVTRAFGWRRGIIRERTFTIM